MNRFLTLAVLLSSLCYFGCSNEAANNNTETEEKREAGESVVREKAPEKKRIVFFGNSLTAAYGLDPNQGFAGLISQRIDSLELDYQVVNAGLSGETTAGGRERIDWILQQPVNIFILELGGNDGLRGIDPEASYENLQAIIDKVREKFPEAKIVLAGMEAPPNMGPEFTQAFRAIYPKLAKENDVTLIPFLLDKVGGEPHLNLADGIHPNPEGHKIVAETIWSVLEGLL